MPVLKRKNELQNLRLVETYITDTNPNSTYFNVFGIPEVVPSGKSAFLINGSGLLKRGSEVKVEIIDALGNVVYTEYPKYLEGSSRLVSIFVYPDTPYGSATLTIVGEATNVPEEWKGLFNVKWQKSILIDPELVNRDKVRFYVTPTLNVSEVTVPYLTSVYGSGSTSTVSAGKISGIPGTNNFTLILSGSSFTGEMVSGTLTVTNPDLPSGIISELTASTVPSYSTTINTVYKNNIAYANKPYITVRNVSPGAKARSGAKTGFQDTVSSIETAFNNSNYTLTFDTYPTLSQTENYRSYAKISLYDMTTFSGDVQSVNIFTKSAGSLQNWELLDSFVLEQTEILVNSASADLSERVGTFINQDVIDNHWSVLRTKTILGNPPQILHDDTKLIDAMHISESDSGRLTADYNLYAQTKFKFPFYADNEYTFKANFYGIKTNKQENFGGRQSLEKQAKIKVYLSGSPFLDFDPEFPKLGKKVGEIEVGTQESETFIDKEFNFYADASGSGKLSIAVDSGDWYVSNVSIKAAHETGFSPDSTVVYIPIPDWERNDTRQFKVEFLNPDGIISSTVVESTDTFFSGGNVYITAKDNLLSGSLYVGNKIGSGVEISGEASALIRSLDYRGYLSASRGTGAGGFLLYSGSVLSQYTNEYASGGVGFEFISRSGSGTLHGIRFGTETGKLEITGSIDAQSGKIANWIIEENRLRATTNKMFLSASGVIETSQSGERIVVDGPNNRIDFYNSQSLILRVGDNLFSGTPGISVEDGIIYTNNSRLWLLKDGDVLGSEDTVIHLDNYRDDDGDGSTANKIYGARIESGRTIDLGSSGSYYGIWAAAENAGSGNAFAALLKSVTGRVLRLSNNDSTLDWVDFYVDSSGIMTIHPVSEEIRYSSSLSPATDASYDLGAAAENLYWRTAFVNTINSDGNTNMVDQVVNRDILRVTSSVVENTSGQDYTITITAVEMDEGSTVRWTTDVRPMVRWWISTDSDFGQATVGGNKTITVASGTQLRPVLISSSSLNETVGNSSGEVVIDVTTADIIGSTNHYIYSEIQGKVYRSAAFSMNTAGS